MRNYPILLTIITCGVFFVLATATSPPDDGFDNFVQLNMSVEVADTNLVVSNNDTLNITSAFLTLQQPTGDSLNGFPITVHYFADGFSLNMGVTDTFPISIFKREDTLVYPVDTFPHSFQLNFQSTQGSGFFDVNF
ncbi:MAG: hypothetical protein ACI85O_002251 [Saprospiraceae bacterium]|jgi:hypothetical protein